MRKWILQFLVAVSCLPVLFAPGELKGEEVWKVAVYKLPGWVKNEREGLSIRFLKIMAKEAGVKIDISVVHRKRMLRTLAQGKVDMVYSYLLPEGQKIPENWNFRFSDFDVTEAGFFVYSAKDIDIGDLNKDTAATILGYENLLGLELKGLKCIPCSLRMVAKGRLDAFLISDVIAVPIIKMEGITGLQKKLYRHIFVKFLFRKDSPPELERRVKEALAKISRSGDYKKIYGVLATDRIIQQYK